MLVKGATGGQLNIRMSSNQCKDIHVKDIFNMGIPILGKTLFILRQGPGPRLNIKTVFPRYGDSHVKDKTVGDTVLSLTWESLYW